MPLAPQPSIQLPEAQTRLAVRQLQQGINKRSISF
jgi:hypothetical protein